MLRIFFSSVTQELLVDSQLDALAEDFVGAEVQKSGNEFFIQKMYNALKRQWRLAFHCSCQ